MTEEEMEAIMRRFGPRPEPRRYRGPEIPMEEFDRREDESLRVGERQPDPADELSDEELERLMNGPRRYR